MLYNIYTLFYIYMEVVKVTQPNPEVIKELNDLTERRLRLEVIKTQAVTEYKTREAALKKKLESVLEPNSVETAEVDARLRELIEKNRSALIDPKKKSFVTMLAKFQFREVPGKIKVTDPKAVMNVARSIGVVRKIGNLTLTWKYDPVKFLRWLSQNDEHRSKFEDYIEDSEDSESLTIQPNGTYAIHHNSKRVSPPSVKI